MIIECKYDPTRDLSEVRPNMSISMEEILRTGVIPAEGATDVDFNAIESPSQVKGRIRDVFDAYEAAQALHSSMATAAAASTDVAE